MEKMRQITNLDMYAWYLWKALKTEGEIQGGEPWLLKLGEIQGLGTGPLSTVNTKSGQSWAWILKYFEMTAGLKVWVQGFQICLRIFCI
jgi:hypothetical protein